jgi:hypothetical protein
MLCVLGALLLLILAVGAALIRSREFFPFALWAALASLVSGVKVLIIENTVSKVSAMTDTKQAKRYALLQYLLRLALTAAVLVGAALASSPSFNGLWGAVAGVLSFQVAALSLRFFKLDEEPHNTGGE